MAEGRKRFIIDIDDTIMKSEADCCSECGRQKYRSVWMNHDLIDRINSHFMAGALIILWTGRNWDCYDLTKEQLRIAGVKHHELVMGKPQGIYVDADALRSLV